MSEFLILAYYPNFLGGEPRSHLSMVRGFTLGLGGKLLLSEVFYPWLPLGLGGDHYQTKFLLSLKTRPHHRSPRI